METYKTKVIKLEKRQFDKKDGSGTYKALVITTQKKDGSFKEKVIRDFDLANEFIAQGPGYYGLSYDEDTHYLQNVEFIDNFQDSSEPPTNDRGVVSNQNPTIHTVNGVDGLKSNPRAENKDIAKKEEISRKLTNLTGNPSLSNTSREIRGAVILKATTEVLAAWGGQPGITTEWRYTAQAVFNFFAEQLENYIENRPKIESVEKEREELPF